MTDREVVIDVIESDDKAPKKAPTAKSNQPTMPKGFDDVVPPADTQAQTDAVVSPADDDDETPSIPRPDNPIKLSKAIRINGEWVSEFEWTDEITSEQFLEADDLAHVRTNRVAFGIAELDNAFNLAIGKMMIVAANQKVDVKDLDQIRGRDLMKVFKLGRFFTNQSGD